MTETVLGWWGVPLVVFAGAMRSSTPFLFVVILASEALRDRLQLIGRAAS